MAAITLKVGGMSCMGCANSVGQLLAQLSGVEKSDVDLNSGSVRIDYDPARVDVAALKRAIVDGGYSVED